MSEIVTEEKILEGLVRTLEKEGFDCKPGSVIRATLEVVAKDGYRLYQEKNAPKEDVPFDTEQPTTDMDKVRRYVALKKRADELDAELKDVKNRMAELEPEVETFFMDNGIQKQSVDGRTVYIATEVWASAGGDKQAACDALKESGLGEYVSDNFNSQSLSAWVREQYKEWQAENPLGTIEEFKATLHPKMQESIKISETHKIKVRKG